MIVVVAKIQVVDGKGKEFEDEYRKLAPRVLSDPGALMYVLHRDNRDPNKYLFIEKYEDQAAIDYHSKAPHVSEFFKKINSITAGRPEISFYTEV